MNTVTIHHRGEAKTVPADGWQGVADEMVARLGPWEPEQSRVVVHESFKGKEPERRVSDFGAGRQVMDDAARERIGAAHTALRDAGVTGIGEGQLYATGTRMAESGYEAQAHRASEHAKKQPIREAAAALVETIKAERRRDVEVTAGDLGTALTMNGALKFDGLKVREQAVRGLLARIKSPALSYVLGVRERIGDGEMSAAHQAMDKEALLDVMVRECQRFADVPLKLRTREGLGDIFAVVSPEYTPADAPEVLEDVLAALPDDARASFAYDPTSTTWELRASVFTPTPTEEQAVGEPFEGYVSFTSRDNGTRRLGGGGGILLVACLNASTYEAATTDVSRVHRGRIMLDLAKMARNATAAISTLCAAWGTARADALDARVHDASGILLPIEDVVPGFFRHMLTARKGELVGVLPGRTEKHVEKLAEMYFDQRRNPATLVRADLAQGFTRYIQAQPSAVRRDAERAIGRWIVGKEKVSFAAA